MLGVVEGEVLFAPKPSKSKVFCSVIGCNSKVSKNTELSFYRLPEAGKIKVKCVIKLAFSEVIDRRVLWERTLRMGKEVMSNMRICSLHFIKKITHCLRNQVSDLQFVYMLNLFALLF